MSQRARIAAGMVAGALWAIAIVWLPQGGGLPLVPVNALIYGALVPPGLVLMAMIASQARRRFFDDALVSGGSYPPGTPGDIDTRVIANTVEQAALAMLLWPFIALTLGGGVVLAMGLGFAVARIAFWIGYRISPALRAFGFAATFYPTILATLWSVWVWAF